MKNTHEPQNLMDIDQLAANVASVVSDVDQASGRVSETPSRRTIRYYSQHGLLDPPVEFKGRKALYGQRHVWQLVAIKQLQARGLALSEIQATLLGVSDTRLQELAAVTPQPSKDDFWRRQPGDLVPRTQRQEQGLPVLEKEREDQAETAQVSQISGVRLDANTVLMIEDLARELHGDDLDAIRVAAEPLMKLLKARHLLR